MNETFRQQLTAAISKDDKAQLEALGWQAVADCLRGLTKHKWNTAADLLPFAIHHASPPGQVIAAIETVALSGITNGYRPTPLQLAPYLATSTASKKDATHPTQTPAALALATRLRAGGQPICHCTPNTTQLYPTTGLMRCPHCGGLDAGQVDDALAVAA